MDISKMLGWRPGLPQQKPFMYFPQRGFLGIPPAVDLQPQCPPIWNQGNLGSCTAQAASALSQFLMKKHGHPWWTPSRLAIYWYTRILERTSSIDSGASLTNTMQVVTRIGSSQESLWWYDIKKFAVKPNQKVAADAAKHKMKAGLSVVQDLVHLKSCLAEGFPFIFGFSVYDSFDSAMVATTGIMPMPKQNEQILGGHAVMAVGYDDKKQMFKIRNSWGTSWGLGGYFWMPYAFISSNNYADDFWTAHEFSTFGV